MQYNPDKEYMVEISLVDDTKDKFNLKGKHVAEMRQRIYQQGYTREAEGVNKGKICYWISPLVIAIVTVTEMNQTLTEKN